MGSDCPSAHRMADLRPETKRNRLDETLKAVEERPEDFSPSALLRPVIQDTLLPTVAYIAGPAEVAYHAQTSLIYKKLLGRAPAILPRAEFYARAHRTFPIC